MSFAEEMSNLGEKLLISCNNRINGTRKMLNKFNQDHRFMARNQCNNLSEFRENLESNTDRMLKRFSNEHKNMSKNQRNQLAEFTNNLADNTKGYLRKCHKQQMNLHDMFEEAHKNFFRCMKEIERKKRNPRSSFEPETPKRKGKKKKTRH